MSTADPTTVYGGDGDDIINVGGYVVNTDYFGGNLNGLLRPRDGPRPGGQ